MITEQDIAWMRRALEVSRLGRRIAPPNPSVGCVLVRDGKVIGEGATRAPGGNHAEIEAMRDAIEKGLSPEGATAYVTLEPCAHWGRTGPCAVALAKAHVARVVAAIADPNPQVAGKGLAILKEAGVEVECGVLEDEAWDSNIGFLTRMSRGTPWVRAKAAFSLDGRTALPNGASKWITSPEARADGHAFRAEAGAILTGIGTVLADDPQMTVRLPGITRQPLRVVVDSTLRMPPTARILEGGVLVVCARADRDRAAALAARGAEVIELPGADGRVDLAALMAELGRRQVNVLHVEAGARLTGALQQAGLIDEYLFYVAPRLLGSGAPVAQLPVYGQVDEAVGLRFHSVERVGSDLRIIARK